MTSTRSAVRLLWATSLLLSLSLGTSARQMSLVEAVKANNPQVARALIAGGAEPNEADADGTTALHWAVVHDDFETTQLLVRRDY